MKNFVFISPHFPSTYYRFCQALRRNGFRVLGIGDCPYFQLADEVKNSLDEYYECYGMENLENQINAVRYFEQKFGKIDYIESNNEYWLESDAKLRTIFGVNTGFNLEEIQICQHKSTMKNCYKKANVKVAQFIMIDTYENALEFSKKVGFPIFAKPDKGVGSAKDFKISNIEELQAFFNEKPANVPYICEQYITGNIVTFDGICDSNSNVIFSTSECFPPSISEIVKKNLDLFYYCLPEVPVDLAEIGPRVVKAFGLKNRYFHFEFFRLTETIKSVGEIGEIVGLETNMRPPGGYTPDLINFANSCDTYQIYADSIAYDKNTQNMSYQKYYAAAASRRFETEYFFSVDDILRTFKNNICAYGNYPNVLSDCLGDMYFMAKFEKLDDLELFHQYVNRKVNEMSIPTAVHGVIKNRYGEGYRILDSRKKEYSRKDDGLSLCDKHIDGA